MGWIDRIWNWHHRRHIDEAEAELRDEHALRQRQWDELAEPIRERAIQHLRRTIPAPLQARIREEIRRDPQTWWTYDETSAAMRKEFFRKHGFTIPTPFHFGIGMEIRNELRRFVAKDKRLPTGNWDDYYIQAVEAAVRNNACR